LFTTPPTITLHITSASFPVESTETRMLQSTYVPFWRALLSLYTSGCSS